MRDSHRVEAERLLARAVEEQARRGAAAGAGAVDGEALLARGLEALDGLASAAEEEYAAYVAALDEAAAGEQSLGEAFRRGNSSTALLVTAVAAVAAAGADLAFGVAAGTAVGTGIVVGVAGAATTVAKVTALHLPAANRRAGAAGRPGGAEQLRLQWLTALEVRGIRPFLEQQRLVATAVRVPARGRTAGVNGVNGVNGVDAGAGGGVNGAGRGKGGPGGGPPLRGGDRSAEARRRSVLEQSFGQLPDSGALFSGRRAELTRIAQWVQAARASTETRPVVVVLHGEPGVGRTALALRAAQALRDQFRGACVVDLRGGTAPGEAPLSTREALLHLLNRLGAPREQLLFREGASAEQQVRRLGELYHQHLQGLPVTVVLDDAVDPEQVRLLVPERSESLVLVTAREPLELPADLGAWVHQLPVVRLAEPEAAEVLRSGARAAGEAAPGAGAEAGLLELGAGLPLALRVLAPLGSARASDGGGGGDGALEHALDLAYARLPEERRRLLRRLTLAGRASLGAAAAAALAGADRVEAGRLLGDLERAGLLDLVRGERYRMHDAVRAYAAARLAADEDRAEAAAAHERLIRDYAKLADSVIRMVDGKMSTRAGQFGGHGFASLDAALRWLDDESSFITAALRHSEGVDQQAVLDLLGALCDFCLLRGDLYRLGEINELARAVDQGRLNRSVQWRTGIAARQLGELDKARTTLASVVDQYREAEQDAGAGMALISLGITLHHQGNLPEAAARIREALVLQEPQELAGDRAWGLHALAAVERDRAHLAEAMALLEQSLALHRESESVHGEAWAHFQLGQVYLRTGEVPRAEAELRRALELYGRTRDDRGEAWALTQLGRARVVDGDPGPALERLREALARHRLAEDARGEAWTLYYLGQAFEEGGERDKAVRELERSRTMFSRMRDVYGLAHARYHSGRVTRDLRAAQTGNLKNSGFARQLLVDARADFRRIGLAHGEAWTCLELAVVDAGNGRVAQAVGLCEDAARLFGSYRDRRGEDWARFLRCTLLPYAAPAGGAGGAGAWDPAAAVEEARAGLSGLAAAAHPLRDGRLEDCLETYAVVLGRGVDPAEGWQAWRLGLMPNLHSQEIMGVPVPQA
ncbi:tetratricopeptide repeat protein [Streptomyces sp. NBC_00249]|uniref:tetratricopeptide repeat protein n=1 Tax=Streptomyces sp. NBC_00249 TaxID=2975690 RepID=UPI0022540DAA|nr:tetratricopeptide repeat protein [Streptomyces sp. NBC_00249]MCX5194751.1 tetratricopeptide repeat protein [Streptomyces sp. NBC_00249]